MVPTYQEETAYLEQFMTERRKARLREVLSHRTRNLVLVLEDIYDPHNASACIRSSEAMGLQELHVAALNLPFKPNPGITNGADKWMDLHRHESVDGCVAHLRERGFHVAAGVLDDDAVPIQEISFAQPVALVFGNEHEGLSKEMAAASDQRFYIPMHGFSQSFNISVASALAVHFAVNERVRHFGQNGDLEEADIEQLYAHWVRLSVSMSEGMLERLRAE